MEAEISVIEAPELIVRPGREAAVISAIVLLNVVASWLAGIHAATSAPPSILK